MRILETAGLLMNLKAGGQGGSELDGLLRRLERVFSCARE